MKLVLFACALFITAAKDAAPVKDVRGGALLSINYPPDVIAAIGDKEIAVSLGNFGHI